MQLAAVRWIADVLRHEQSGVLAEIADGVPGGVDLPLIQIADETREDGAWIAYGTYPKSVKDKGPCMIVRAIGTGDNDTVQNVGGGIETCTVAVHMVMPVTVEGVPADVARLHTAFLLRLAKRCIAKAIPDEVGRANPVVFGCTIVPPRESAFSYAPLYDPETLGGGIIIDALLVTVSVDDPYARGFEADVAPTP